MTPEERLQEEQLHEEQLPSLEPLLINKILQEATPSLTDEELTAIILAFRLERQKHLSEEAQGRRTKKSPILKAQEASKLLEIDFGKTSKKRGLEDA